MILNLLVETLSYHFHFSVLNASLDLSADCSEVLSDAYSNILHIIGCELPVSLNLFVYLDNVRY